MLFKFAILPKRSPHYICQVFRTIVLIFKYLVLLQGPKFPLLRFLITAISLLSNWTASSNAVLPNSLRIEVSAPNYSNFITISLLSVITA